ncbi:MAG: radical SAM protein [Chloroflexales bacterium]|nr:radical SAM protein [Chloroflexales bacterium]
MDQLLPAPTVIADDQMDDPAYGDCDCACPQAQHIPAAAPSPTARLEPHPQLRALRLDDEHSVAFVPSHSRVAVLDRPARALIARLADAVPLADLPPAEAAAAGRMAALGLLRERGAPDARPPAPDQLVVWLHVTNACNLRCTYCYLEKTDEAMSEATAHAAVDAALRSAVANGYRRVLMKYAGGEASLNLPLVALAHRYALGEAAARDIALDGVVLSNGVGLTSRRLAIINDLGLRLMISLDGPAAYHDAQRPTVRGQPSHAAAAASALRAQAMGLALNLSITVTGQSVAGLPDLVAWALDHNLRFALNFYRENDCSASRADLLLDEQRLIAGIRAAYAVIEERLPPYSLLGCLVDRANLGAAHERACAAGENYLVIDHHGQIASCQMAISSPVTTTAAADPLRQIRLDPRGVQNIPVDQKEGCRDCEWRYWCAGGCAVATFRATGRYDVRSPSCNIYKALYPDVVRLEGLRLLSRHLAAVAA